MADDSGPDLSSADRGPRLFAGRRRANATGGPRRHVTKIKHSEDEWALVAALAEAQQVSVPRLYERALRSGGVVVAAKVSQIHDELWGVRRALAAQGNNLNQLTRVANATGALQPELNVTLGRLLDTVDRLNELLGRLPDSEQR